MGRETKAKGKSFSIVVILIFVGLCMLVPVWQSAVSAGIHSKIERSKANIMYLSEKQIVEKGQIARRTTPEYLIEQASVQNINFTQIRDSIDVTVASVL